jgi:hypothetical protein
MAIDEVLRGQTGQCPGPLGQFDQRLQIHQADTPSLKTSLFMHFI